MVQPALTSERAEIEKKCALRVGIPAESSGTAPEYDWLGYSQTEVPSVLLHICKRYNDIYRHHNRIDFDDQKLPP